MKREGGGERFVNENTHQRRVEVGGLELVLLPVVVRVGGPVCCVCARDRQRVFIMYLLINALTTNDPILMHAPDVAEVGELEALVRLDGGAPARGRPAEKGRGGLLLPRAVIVMGVCVEVSDRWAGWRRDPSHPPWIPHLYTNTLPSHPTHTYTRINNPTHIWLNLRKLGSVKRSRGSFSRHSSSEAASKRCRKVCGYTRPVAVCGVGVWVCVYGVLILVGGIGDGVCVCG